MEFILETGLAGYQIGHESEVKEKDDCHIFISGKCEDR